MAEMQFLFDTNVVLDVVLQRSEWLKDSLALWQAHHENKIVGYVSANSITDIYYLVRRQTNEATALKAVQLCLVVLEILPVNKETLWLAEGMKGGDFEDNVQIACATQANLNGIITRDKKGFELSEIQVYTPAELLAELARRK